MNEAKKYQLQDLIEKIDSVDKMIKMHSSNPSPFMLSQYKAKKEKLLGYLIDELVDAKVRSPYSFKLILLAINKYYPNLNSSKKLPAEKSYKELKELEAVYEEHPRNDDRDYDREIRMDSDGKCYIWKKRKPRAFTYYFEDTNYDSDWERDRETDICPSPDGCNFNINLDFTMNSIVPTPESRGKMYRLAQDINFLREKYPNSKFIVKGISGNTNNITKAEILEEAKIYPTYKRFVRCYIDCETPGWNLRRLRAMVLYYLVRTFGGILDGYTGDENDGSYYGIIITETE